MVATHQRNGDAEEAAKFYVSVFPNSEVKSANPMTATIVANGTEILMFNGGPSWRSTSKIPKFRWRNWSRS